MIAGVADTHTALWHLFDDARLFAAALLSAPYLLVLNADSPVLDAKLAFTPP